MWDNAALLTEEIQSVFAHLLPASQQSDRIVSKDSVVRTLRAAEA
jgi:hypothetical protein